LPNTPQNTLKLVQAYSNSTGRLNLWLLKPNPQPHIA
jgi:hypothetical protein